MNKHLINISKSVSYALRHNPSKFGLQLDPEGWTGVEALCGALSVTRADIDEIIRTSEKKRFEIVGDRIRATYGHSVEKKIAFKPVEPPDVLYHGTSLEAAQSILDEGIKPMGRQYVHLSSDLETARKVGLRHAKDERRLRVFSVCARLMHRDGFKFYHSANDGTWMCEAVPTKYLERQAKDVL